MQELEITWHGETLQEDVNNEDRNWVLPSQTCSDDKQITSKPKPKQMAALEGPNFWISEVTLTLGLPGQGYNVYLRTWDQHYFRQAVRLLEPNFPPCTPSVSSVGCNLSCEGESPSLYLRKCEEEASSPSSLFNRKAWKLSCSHIFRYKLYQVVMWSGLGFNVLLILNCTD